MYTHHTYVNTDTRLCSNLDTFGPSPPQATPSLCSPYSRVSSPAGTPPPPGPRSHCPDDASQSHHPGKTSSRRREEGVSAAGVSGVAVLRCGSPTRGECCPEADLHTAPCGNKKKKKRETSAGRRQGPCRCSVGPTLLVGARLGFSARGSRLCVPYLSFHS